MLIRHLGEFKWENIPVLAYKEEGNHFKSITRQLLLEGEPGLPCQLRYFEVAPGGHSTLERHEHVHFVVILRGEGEVLVGKEVYHVREKDVLVIPTFTWHQLRATVDDSPLGFLCLVKEDRDKAILPTEDDLQLLKSDPVIAAFIKS
jgi:quercetin dioxygenase-like cupin family protein